MLLANELESITLPDGTTQALGPAARDTFSISEDLCLFGTRERPQILQLEYLHKTFSLELVESVLTNYHQLFCKVCFSSFTHPRTVCESLPCSQHSELLLLLQHHLFPLLLKTLSERSVVPLSLRGTRVVFLLLKQFFRARDGGRSLTLHIIFIGAETDAGES